MRTKVIQLLVVLIAVSVIAVGFAVSQESKPTTLSSKAGQGRPKSLREKAKERDVEVKGVDGSHHLTYVTLENIKESASAIVYGRIIGSQSHWDDSGAPIEHGETITTEYNVEVLRVMRDTTLEIMRPGNKPTPAPVTTPLKVARNGGTVNVNGHRASVKVEGYERLMPGKTYIFFLHWAPDYKAYVLAVGLFSVIRVNEDLSLETLSSSKELQDDLREVKLENLISQIRQYQELTFRGIKMSQSTRSQCLVALMLVAPNFVIAPK